MIVEISSTDFVEESTTGRSCSLKIASVCRSSKVHCSSDAYLESGRRSCRTAERRAGVVIRPTQRYAGGAPDAAALLSRSSSTCTVSAANTPIST